MSAPNTSEGQQYLTLQNARVRRLALAIAGDANQADDLAQDAWVALLRRQPPESGRMPDWLGGMMLNILRLKRRADTRRTERERAAARPEAEAAGDLAL
jgi:DNA-directed RNA polymerase specialized sigma24 family protein